MSPVLEPHRGNIIGVAEIEVKEPRSAEKFCCICSALEGSQ